MNSYWWAVCPLLVVIVEAAVPLIIDTDIGGGGCNDVDDVAAVCVANALADNGEVELLAIVHNTHPPQCVGAISVLNHYYSRDDVPIGAYKGKDLHISKPHKYVPSIVNNFPSPIKNSSQVPDAVDVYRKVLAAQPDHSVVISSIGLLTNLAALLRSKADKYSQRTGPELIASKVKLLAVMGGSYPSGSECNFRGGIGADHATGAAASSYVFKHWPPTVRVLFSGAEVGSHVYSGRALPSCVPANNPCRHAFESATSAGRIPDLVNPVKGRMSWDPLTTLAAVRGVEAVGCVECSYCDGTNSVNGSTGRNEWIRGPKSKQSYLVLHDKDAAGVALDRLLCQLPRKTPPEPVPPRLPGTRLLETGATTGAGPEDTSFGGGDYAAAWDGYTSSFYDYSKSNGGWTRADLIQHSSVAAIQYYPRRGFIERCVGGLFVGITPAGKAVTLANITTQPAQDWNTVYISHRTEFAAVEYVGPNMSNGNMAEIRLYAKHWERTLSVEV